MDSETVEHDGHTIEVRLDDSEPVLLVDDEPVRWGRFSGDGKFFLHPYAYDADESLVELARRYVEYRDRVEQRRASGE